MKREPSIHITATQFNEIWEKLGGYKLSDDFIGKLFRMARGYSLDHRSVMLSNQKMQKTVTRRVSSSVGDANLLADVIYSSRVRLKHVGVTKIKQTDMQWAQVKELVPVINEFCSTFNLQKRQGYIAYVETGLKLMAKSKRVNYNYCASWLLQKSDWVISTYESEVEISTDKYPEETRQVHDIYCTKVLEMTGMSNNYSKDSSQYVNFLYARKLADEIGVDYETFIDAQFDALNFCNGIPKLEDLSNDKASQRLTQYLSKNGYVLADAKSMDNSMWDSFKR